MQIIPFKEPSFWREQLTLDDEIFVFYFKWNALNAFWVMDIYNRDEEPIIVGIKIVPNYDLLAAYNTNAQPKGNIICQNIVGTFDEIGRFDMSQKFELVYYNVGELDALQSDS